MKSSFRCRNPKKLLCSALVAAIVFSILSVLIYHGEYFQNRLLSAYGIPVKYLSAGWILAAICFCIGFYRLWLIDTDGTDFLFLYAVQWGLFALSVLSVYCFGAVILAFVSCLLSVLFTLWLTVLLWKYKQGVSAVMMLVFMAALLCFLFVSFLFVSVEYGIWKD